MERNDLSYGIIPLFRSGNQCIQLLVQDHHGNWGFPKGHPKEGETGFKTALRELYEETGITDCNFLPGISFTDNYQYTAENGDTVHKTVTYYLAAVNDPRIETKETDGEIKATQWVDADTALQTLQFESRKKLINEVQHYLHSQNFIQ